MALEGCDKSTILTSGRDSIESCSRCKPGYYEVRASGAEYDKFANIATDTFVHFCYPIKDKLQRVHFVASYSSTEYNDLLDPYFEVDMGLTAENPIYSLQGVLKDYQGDEAFYSKVRGSAEVIVEIYLMKGVHHYITCLDSEELQNWAPFVDNP